MRQQTCKKSQEYFLLSFIAFVSGSLSFSLSLCSKSMHTNLMWERKKKHYTVFVDSEKLKYWEPICFLMMFFFRSLWRRKLLRQKKFIAFKRKIFLVFFKQIMKNSFRNSFRAQWYFFWMCRIMNYTSNFMTSHQLLLLLFLI